MKLLIFEEFKEICLSNKFCLRKNFKSKVCEKDYKIKKCYEKYVEKFENNINLIKIDEKWEEVKQNVDIRDNYKCQLICKLNVKELDLLYKHGNISLIKILDHAHVIGRGANVKLKYDLDNIWTINRQSHLWLDQMCSPLTGEPISNTECETWWNYITNGGVSALIKKLKDGEN